MSNTSDQNSTTKYDKAGNILGSLVEGDTSARPGVATFTSHGRLASADQPDPSQTTERGLMHQPPPEHVGYPFHWIQFCDDEPLVWEWSRLHKFWVGTPWHYKCAPDKPNAGWTYLAPAIPPKSGKSP